MSCDFGWKEGCINMHCCQWLQASLDHRVLGPPPPVTSKQHCRHSCETHTDCLSWMWGGGRGGEGRGREGEGRGGGGGRSEGEGKWRGGIEEAKGGGGRVGGVRIRERRESGGHHVKSNRNAISIIHNTVGRSIASIFDLSGIFTSVLHASVNMSPRVWYIGYRPAYCTIYITKYYIQNMYKTIHIANEHAV